MSFEQTRLNTKALTMKRLFLKQSNTSSCAWSGPYKEALLPYVEVDVLTTFVGYKSAEVTAGNAVPDTAISLFKGALHV